MCSLNFINYHESLSGSFVVMGSLLNNSCHYHTHHKYWSILLVFSELRINCTFLSRATRLAVMSLAATVYLLVDLCYQGVSLSGIRPLTRRELNLTQRLLLCSFTDCTAAVSGDVFIIRGILSLTVIVDCLGGSLQLPRVLSPTGVLLQHIQL